jgi:hypothetical protein
MAHSKAAVKSRRYLNGHFTISAFIKRFELGLIGTYAAPVVGH